MPEINNHGTADIKPYSVQHILNQSFDRTSQSLFFQVVGTDGQSLQIQNASNLSLKIDYNGGTNPIYLGIAAPGTTTSDANWQIRKLTFDGNNNITSIQYANGSSEFDQIYDDRASLSYS